MGKRAPIKTFLVTLVTPGLGSYVLGFIRKKDQKSAQQAILKQLADIGIDTTRVWQEGNDLLDFSRSNQHGTKLYIKEIHSFLEQAEIIKHFLRF